MNQANGIEVTSVQRNFGAVQAVADISFAAPAGKVTALIGPNGSGKTTLLLMLASLLKPDHGSIRLNGLDPVTQAEQIRPQLGWMPDGFGSWDSLTVREVLSIVGTAYRLPKAEINQQIDKVITETYLKDLADRPARVLSRGQKQRLGLARALVHNPSILLLDEPASGLDPRSRIELRDLLRNQAAAGKTVLVSSHILTELQEIADAAVIVANGRTIATQDLNNLNVSQTLWRITSLNNPQLETELKQQNFAVHAVAGGFEIGLANDVAASELLAKLVHAGVPITSLTPTQSALESAYLAATEERK